MVNRFFDDFAIRELPVLMLFPMFRIEFFVYQGSNVYLNFLPYFIDFAPVYIKEFFCGLHNLCSHIMARSDLFIYLSTRVERLSRGLVSWYRTAH